MQLTTLAQIHGLTGISRNNDESISCSIPGTEDYGLSMQFIHDNGYPVTFVRVELYDKHSGSGSGTWEVPTALLALALQQVAAYMKVYDEYLESAA